MTTKRRKSVALPYRSTMGPFPDLRLRMPLTLFAVLMSSSGIITKADHAALQPNLDCACQNGIHLSEGGVILTLPDWSDDSFLCEQICEIALDEGNRDNYLGRRLQDESQSAQAADARLNIATAVVSHVLPVAHGYYRPENLPLPNSEALALATLKQRMDSMLEESGHFFTNEVIVEDPPPQLTIPQSANNAAGGLDFSNDIRVPPLRQQIIQSAQAVFQPQPQVQPSASLAAAQQSPSLPRSTAIVNPQQQNIVVASEASNPEPEPVQPFIPEPEPIPELRSSQDSGASLKINDGEGQIDVEDEPGGAAFSLAKPNLLTLVRKPLPQAIIDRAIPPIPKSPTLSKGLVGPLGVKRIPSIPLIGPKLPPRRIIQGPIKVKRIPLTPPPRIILPPEPLLLELPPKKPLVTKVVPKISLPSNPDSRFLFRGRNNGKFPSIPVQPKPVLSRVPPARPYRLPLSFRKGFSHPSVISTPKLFQRAIPPAAIQPAPPLKAPKRVIIPKRVVAVKPARLLIVPPRKLVTPRPSIILPPPIRPPPVQLPPPIQKLPPPLPPTPVLPVVKPLPEVKFRPPIRTPIPVPVAVPVALPAKRQGIEHEFSYHCKEQCYRPVPTSPPQCRIRCTRLGIISKAVDILPPPLPPPIAPPPPIVSPLRRPFQIPIAAVRPIAAVPIKAPSIPRQIAAARARSNAVARGRAAVAAAAAATALAVSRISKSVPVVPKILPGPPNPLNPSNPSQFLTGGASPQVLAAAAVASSLRRAVNNLPPPHPIIPPPRRPPFLPPPPFNALVQKRRLQQQQQQQRFLRNRGPIKPAGLPNPPVLPSPAGAGSFPPPPPSLLRRGPSPLYPLHLRSRLRGGPFPISPILQRARAKLSFTQRQLSSQQKQQQQKTPSLLQTAIREIGPPPLHTPILHLPKNKSTGLRPPVALPLRSREGPFPLPIRRPVVSFKSAINGGSITLQQLPNEIPIGAFQIPAVLPPAPLLPNPDKSELLSDAGRLAENANLPPGPLYIGRPPPPPGSNFAPITSPAQSKSA